MKRILAVLLLLGLQAAPLWAQPPGARPPRVEEARVTNPTSGVELFVQLYRPAGAGPWPALVLVPGGSSAGSQAFRPPEAQGYADLGYLVTVFDPDGRGRSAGLEDDNGHVHQDGLAAVVRFAAAHPDGTGRAVLASFSYGVTLASGALARHSDLPVDFFVDWEGPANRDDTGGCDGAGLGHLQSVGCANEAFWAQREAATFMREVGVPYQRVQRGRDHVQPDNAHALLLVNRATDRAFGGEGRAPWTRLNDLPPNRTYPDGFDQGWLPDGARAEALVGGYLAAFLDGELFDAPAQTAANPLQLAVMVHLEGWPLERREAFERYAALVRDYAEQFARHGALLTLESKESTAAIARWGDNFLAELEAAGHGVGVHADLGGNRNRNYTYPQFVGDLARMKGELDALVAANRHVSGTCSHLDWVSAAVEAGYAFVTGVVAYCYSSLPEAQRPPPYRDCPNPAACHQSPFETLAEKLHPWRARDGASWPEHDPAGKLVILPQAGGLPCLAEEARARDSFTQCTFAEDDVDAYVDLLEEALALADPDRVNALYVSWSLGTPLDAALLERWLEAVAPYVASGQAVWRTLPQIYDAYVEWERAAPSGAVLDRNGDGAIDDAEVLLAVRAWALDAPLPGTRTRLSDAEVLAAVRAWVGR